MSLNQQSLLPKTMTQNTLSVLTASTSQSSQQIYSSQELLFDTPNGESTMILPRRPVPEFLFQLTQMLSDPSNHHLIEWSGRRVVVHDPVNLEKEVLQQYFRHSKYSSFQRQMNYFGFRKNAGKSRMSPCTYENDSVSDDLSSLLFIKRKTQGAASSAKKKAKATKTKEDAASSTGSVSDDESHDMPKGPLSQTPDICTSHIAPKTDTKTFDNVPLVVTAEEYGASGTINFTATTPANFTPPPFLSSKVLVEPPSLVFTSPPFCPVAPPLSQPFVVSASPEPTAEEMFAHHQHNVPNPLLVTSYQHLPCPSLPATAAVESNNPQEGGDLDLSSQFVPDLTLGFSPLSQQQMEDCKSVSVVSDDVNAALSSPLPSSNTIFALPPKSPSLVSVDEADGGYEQNELCLSPSTSLVDLAMIPISTSA